MKEALKLALEALEGFYEYGYDRRECFEHITAIKEALAQPERTWKGQIDNDAFFKSVESQPEQEPVAWESILGAVARGWCYEENANKTMDSDLAVAIAKEVQSLYTTPPQRKPLTDEQTIILKSTTCPEIDWKARYFVEMNNGERNKWMLEWFMAFKVAIEAAHNIKE